ncbi:MAG: anthranilate phosphoribosyltransferase [Planctomycetota bacterium]|nr:anthranilate phosphoribosyltransferase [Planctomycetota bacterium]
MSVKQLLRDVVAGQPVDASRLEDVLHEAMAGVCDPVALGALLAALACRKPEADWLVAGARALRSHGVAVRPQVRPLVDTCGTGGAGSGTFNVSTATAFVVAGAGCAVAKHGNRGVSSPVGSADVLEALGVQLEQTPQRAKELIDAFGFAFLFAPSFHPAMRHVAPIRRALGVRTLFNLLGPLASPAYAEFQLVGVYAASLTGVVAEALQKLGSQGAMVVHCDGVDEIGLHAVTEGHVLCDGAIEPLRIAPEELGLQRAGLDALQGAGDKEGNAELLRRALRGDGGACSAVVAATAAAALHLAGRAPTLRDGVAMAQEVMAKGTAERVLARYAESSRCGEEVTS